MRARRLLPARLTKRPLSLRRSPSAAFAAGPLADIDAALEEGAVFDGDTRRDNIAGQRTIAADIDAITRSQIAAHLAQHDDLARINVGSDHSVAAHRHPIAGKID